MNKITKNNRLSLIYSSNIYLSLYTAIQSNKKMKYCLSAASSINLFNKCQHLQGNKQELNRLMTSI